MIWTSECTSLHNVKMKEQFMFRILCSSVPERRAFQAFLLQHSRQTSVRRLQHYRAIDTIKGGHGTVFSRLRYHGMKPLPVG